MNSLSTAAARSVAAGFVLAISSGWAAAQTVPASLQDSADLKPLAAVVREAPVQASASGAVSSGPAAVKAVREITSKDEMVPDRPDFTESSVVVPRGGFQFESGMVYEGDTRDGVHGRNLTVPSSLLRIGLNSRTE